MQNIGGRTNCYFGNSTIADLIFVLIRVLLNQEDLQLSEIYTDAYIKKIKQENKYLSELVEALPGKGSEMLEFLLLGDNFEDVGEYKRLVKGMEETDFFYYFFGGYIDKQLLLIAIKDDTHLDMLYLKHKYICPDSEVLKKLIKCRNKFIDDFFSCLDKLYTDKFINEYKIFNDKLTQEFYRLEGILLHTEPLELSQKIMGKTFKNRGPYDSFIFVPSIWINCNAIRYFGKKQILMYSAKEKGLSKVDIINILKVISDEKRFEIIELLTNSTPLMGKELVERLELSKATVSHHIEQLKGIGFINEERVKNSKYYSINTNSVNEFLDYLSSKMKK